MDSETHALIERAVRESAEEHSSVEDQLREALASRTVIGQATGILIERFGLEPDTAFSVLRRLSQHQNIRVVCLARYLVEHGNLPGLLGGPGTAA